MKYLKQIRNVSLILVIVILLGIYLHKNTKTGHNQLQPVNAMVYPVSEQKALKVKGLIQSNRGTFHVNDWKNQWTFIFFGYTYCPDICPATMSTLKQMLTKLPEEVLQNTFVQMVSVDPERDTVDHLEKYTQSFHPNMFGVTASHDVLQPFARQFGAIYHKVDDHPEHYIIDHTSKIFLVNPDGKRVAFFDKSKISDNHYDFDIDQMVKDFLIIRNNHQL